MQVVHAQLLAFQRYPIPTAFGGVKGLGVATASRERLQNVIPESPFLCAVDKMDIRCQLPPKHIPVRRERL